MKSGAPARGHTQMGGSVELSEGLFVGAGVGPSGCQLRRPWSVPAETRAGGKAETVASTKTLAQNVEKFGPKGKSRAATIISPSLRLTIHQVRTTWLPALAGCDGVFWILWRERQGTAMVLRRGPESALTNKATRSMEDSSRHN